MSTPPNLTTEPLVSAIIPAYNAGVSLAKAISSALSQTYPSIEVVVVDDGSTDRVTQKIIEPYLDRIRYIRQENGGVAAARQTGIEASHGELIALLDQDDVWLPGKIRREVDALKEHPRAGLVHSSYYLIGADGKREGVVRLPQREYDPLPELLIEVPVSSCTTLFTKEALFRAGPFDPPLSSSDDWDMWLRIAALGYSFVCVGEPLAEYRIHGANQSRDLDRMSRTGLGVLDKFYALESIPAVVRQYKNKAYAARHAWAASVYYGAHRLDRAERHTMEAAKLYPESVVSTRFLQSLVYSTTQQPHMQEAEAAVRFCMGTLAKSGLPDSAMRRLRARAQLVLAVHARPVSNRQFIKRLAGAVLTDPAILADRKLWKTIGQMPSRAARRLGTRLPFFAFGGKAMKRDAR